MKRTTYIIIAHVDADSLRIVIEHFLRLCNGAKTKKYAVELSAEYKELSVAGVRALALMKANTPHRVYAFGFGGGFRMLNINHTLYYPKRFGRLHKTYNQERIHYLLG